MSNYTRYIMIPQRCTILVVVVVVFSVGVVVVVVSASDGIYRERRRRRRVFGRFRLSARRQKCRTYGLRYEKKETEG